MAHENGQIGTKRCHVLARRVVFIYLILGAIWIIASDRIAAALAPDPQSLTFIQTWKGWAYVGVTALLLYLLIDRALKSIQHSEGVLERMRVRYKTLVETMNEGVWVLDAAGSTVFVNDRMARILGVDQKLLTEYGVESYLTGESRIISNKQLEERPTNGAATFDLEFRRADGSRAHALVSASPLYDKDGHFMGAIRAVQDITRRVQAEESLRRAYDTQSRLLDELNHRVRNNLGALLTLIDSAHKNSPDLDDFAQILRDRVWGFSAAHSLLAESRWSTVEFRALLETMFQRAGLGRFRLSGAPVRLPPMKTGPLAVAISELVNISRRFGALSSDKGRIEILWSLHPIDAMENRLTIEWNEREAGHAVADSALAPDVSIVEGLVRSDLAGSFSRSHRDGQSRYIIEFNIPIPVGAAADDATANVAARRTG